MKTFLHYLFLLIGLTLSYNTTFAQKSVNPHISFKIELRLDGYYYGTMKSDTTLSSVSPSNNISTIQFTVVAPIGTFSPISYTGSTVLNLQGSIEDLVPSDNLGSYLWTIQRSTYDANTEYAFIGMTGSPRLTNTITKDVEIPLFRFRLQNCLGNIRMYQNGIDLPSRSGTALLNTDCSIYLSRIKESLADAYKDNYGGPAACLTTPIPDLMTSLTAPSSGAPNTAYSYTVSVMNVGSGASSGIVSESFSLPAGLTFNSGGGNGWTCAVAGTFSGTTTVTCTNPAPNLPASGSINFPLAVTPTSLGAFTVTAQVSGGGETNTNNNNATSNTTSIGCGVSAGEINRL
ncbi:hypothetical protein QM480_04910 [Flectobacillus sp. DC10W]|uniref:DUF11 domain-containing protein n=1 Tax=Flectobacillus longus TaxID=2984207 RepID=A0ABT6YKF3_9BACT|nr:hypothetical protein [Flectobacillus longus]MDI9863651.1 hypothetical protein [Flectobacillus longus]